MIILKVPGTTERYGTFVCELGFDDMVKVHITHYLNKKKRKALSETEVHWYLAHKEDVEYEVTNLEN